MSSERDLIVEQRQLLISSMAQFYPNARKGESYFMVMLGPFPEYGRRYAFRDFTYLEEKGYIRRCAKGKRPPEPGTPWDECYWVLTAQGFEVAQRIVQDPALEV